MSRDRAKWAQADRISDAIVDLLREEARAPDMHPLEVLAGQLLAFKAYLASAPQARPSELRAFEQAVDRCLHVLLQQIERGGLHEKTRS